MQRRDFLLTAGHTIAAGVAASSIVHSGYVCAGETPRKIKVGQIGTAHAHASGKMDALRKLTDHYEVVGVVEPDPALREAARRQATYRDLPWMSEAGRVGQDHPRRDGTSLSARPRSGRSRDGPPGQRYAGDMSPPMR